MITNNKKDLVDEALNALSTFIDNRCKASNIGSENTLLIDCAK